MGRFAHLLASTLTIMSPSFHRSLRLTRLYYFTFLGGSGFIMPYLNLFYARLGLSGTQIGWVAAAAALVALVAAPLWASRARRSRSPRRFLQGALLLVAAGYLWLSRQTTFAAILLVTAARTLVGAGIGPQSDALALQVTRRADAGFGSVRVWASIGWIFSVLAGGWLAQQVGIQASFWGVTLVTLLAIVLVGLIDIDSFIPSVPNGERRLPLLEANEAPPIPLPGIRQAVDFLLHSPAMLGVALMMFVIGIANSGVLQFETIYLDSLGASESLLGVAGVLGAVVEVPCMLWADSLVRRRGPHLLLMLAMPMNIALRGIIFLLPGVSTIMLVRAMGGVSFSFYTVALVKFISQQSEAAGAGQMTGTLLALYTVTLTSLIGIIASPLAGFLFDHLGARGLYPIAALGYLLGWLILWLTRRSSKI